MYYSFLYDRHDVCHLILIIKLSSIVMPHYYVHYYYKRTDISGVEVTSPNSLNSKFQK